MGNSYTDSKGNTSTSNINNTKSGLPRSQEVDVKKHYTTDGDLHLNKNHVSNSNPHIRDCLLYTSPSPRDLSTSRMPSSA